ncbi:hypothetical protein B0H17DRAFT_1134290 [Mycena rosella]|uniref:Uncharacterized protein n=1 Tax=Mycena rosella TaxID=1033263 RepID=A0AAD7DFH7_MYCRO|nr:hypothetical protein B0H17DRAFT_1134290 [Mycena rosella]
MSPHHSWPRNSQAHGYTFDASGPGPWLPSTLRRTAVSQTEQRKREPKLASTARARAPNSAASRSWDVLHGRPRFRTRCVGAPSGKSPDTPGAYAWRLPKVVLRALAPAGPFTTPSDFRMPGVACQRKEVAARASVFVETLEHNAPPASPVHITRNNRDTGNHLVAYLHFPCPSGTGKVQMTWMDLEARNPLSPCASAILGPDIRCGSADAGARWADVMMSTKSIPTSSLERTQPFPAASAWLTNVETRRRHRPMSGCDHLVTSGQNPLMYTTTSCYVRVPPIRNALPPPSDTLMASAQDLRTESIDPRTDTPLRLRAPTSKRASAVARCAYVWTMQSFVTLDQICRRCRGLRPEEIPNWVISKTPSEPAQDHYPVVLTPPGSYIAAVAAFGPRILNWVNFKTPLDPTKTSIWFCHTRTISVAAVAAFDPTYAQQGQC